MMQEKYNLIHHKDFHNLQLQNYSVKERAIFLTLCLKIMEQDDEVVTFKVSEIAKIANYTPRKKGDNIYLFLKELSDKLLKLQVMQIKKDVGFTNMVLFPTFTVNEIEKTVRIRINPDYKYLLNNLQAPYTIQALIEYSNLKSGYSQLMYSILKCWNKAKKIRINIDDFKRELGVPENYRIFDIDQRVIAPILKELPQYFDNLKVEKIKEGKSVIALEFTWDDKKIVEQIVEEEEIELTEELMSAIEKAEKNRFIKPFLTDENIIKLLEKFSQEQLERGLKAAYDLIKTEFASLNYLVKVIEDNINKPKRKVILKRTRSSETTPEDAEIEKEATPNDIKIEKKVPPVTMEEYQQVMKIYEITKDNFGYSPEEIRAYIEKHKDLL